MVIVCGPASRAPRAQRAKWIAKKHLLRFAYISGMRAQHSSSQSVARWFVRRQGNRLELRDRATRRLVRVLQCPAKVVEAFLTGNRQPRIAVTLSDQRTQVYAAATGRLLFERADPAKDLAIQAEFRALMKELRSPIRYVLVKPISPRFTAFYDIESSTWCDNELPRNGVFKDKALAVSACAALNRLRNKRSARSLYFAPRGVPVQVLAVRIARPAVLSKVHSRVGAYRPRIKRAHC